MTPPTPTPWHKEENGDPDPRGHTIYGPNNEAICRMAHWRDDDPLDELLGNLDLIVRCVNEREGLLKALKDAIDVLSYIEENSDLDKLQALTPEGEHFEEFIARISIVLAAAEQEAV